MAHHADNNDWIQGRGAQFDPHNRYEKDSYDREHAEGIDDWEQEARKTRYIEVTAKTILNEVKSPDVSMVFSLNPYQGCEHGCIYCYARNTHEYWGLSAGLDFESQILVKKNAPELLRAAFMKKSWKPVSISLSGNTDCYQPIERKTGITRKLLEVCLEFGNPVGIITKNALVLRDLDLLKALAEKKLVRVFTSVTSMDEKLRSVLEPRTSTYASRMKTLARLSAEGIPTGVMNAPLIPGLNDMHMHDTLKAAAEAGASWAGYTIVRLNGPIGDLFKDWLYKAYPDRAAKVWSQIESCHGGHVNDSRFSVRMKGEGHFATLIKNQFQLYCKKWGLNQKEFQPDTTLFRRPSADGQLELF